MAEDLLPGPMLKPTTQTQNNAVETCLRRLEIHFQNFWANLEACMASPPPRTQPGDEGTRVRRKGGILAGTALPQADTLRPTYPFRPQATRGHPPSAPTTQAEN
ncbi:Hypothetical predicted protein [Pelobates cultripes]|uniref:Uncharacterized protein n=1 Tax=Pelobates cultripes TaxID=61616 RepID=A0AAD1RA61_PELCU|nr:Hypothetical predicted protein [Pelobates cultripes]